MTERDSKQKSRARLNKHLKANIPIPMSLFAEQLDKGARNKRNSNSNVEIDREKISNKEKSKSTKMRKGLRELLKDLHEKHNVSQNVIGKESTVSSIQHDQFNSAEDNRGSQLLQRESFPSVDEPDNETMNLIANPSCCNDVEFSCFRDSD